MTLAFITNYFTPHQYLLSEAFNKIFDSYHFIETMNRPEVIPIGWQFDGKMPNYVITSENLQMAKHIVDVADVVIIGMAPDSFLNYRHLHGLLNFRYSERIFKTKCKKWQLPLRFIKYYFRCNRHKNDYLLCASAYSAADYAITNSFIGKSFKWGYFPDVSKLEINELLSKKKENNIIHFLWVGRFIDWKHPEKAVYLAEYLKKSGYVFKMNMLGDGPMLDEIATLISKKGLSERINMLGSLKPSGVRSVMDASDVFIYTSDFNEGWGAVLNEAMASGCIAVASHAIGSAPFLIQDGVNGFLYQNDDIHTLTSVVEKILNMEYRQRIEIATRAKDTISELWNANIAAQRLKKLAETLLSGDTHFLYENGPCSCAPILTNNWFESM